MPAACALQPVDHIGLSCWRLDRARCHLGGARRTAASMTALPIGTRPLCDPPKTPRYSRGVRSGVAFVTLLVVVAGVLWWRSQAPVEESAAAPQATVEELT